MAGLPQRGWMESFYGTLFGKTKKAAVSSFNFSDEYEGDTP